MRVRLLLAVALCASVVALPGVGTAAAAAPTKQQLALVVLPKDALGSRARGLQPDLGSGYEDAAAAAEATLDPDDTARQLTRGGWLGGYALTYSDLSFRPLARGRGLLGIGSNVALFASPAAADAFVTKQLRDRRELRGKRVELGVRMEGSSTFGVRGLGDRSGGFVSIVRMGGKRLYGTTAYFREGALVAAVDVVRADAASEAGSAERLARSLARRVALVAAGRLAAKPVAVPAVGREGRPPRGGPELSSIALSLGELPKGATLVREGYTADDDALATYEREFDTTAARFGGSVLTSLECDVSLYRSAAEAGGALRVIRLLYRSPSLPQELQTLFNRGPGPVFRNLTLEEPPAVAVGDESATLVFHATVNGLRVRLAFLHVRVERAVGTLILVGPAASYRVADTKGNIAMLVKRIERGL